MSSTAGLAEAVDLRRASATMGPDDQPAIDAGTAWLEPLMPAGVSDHN